MGLDAVVFRNAKKLQEQYGPDLFETDQTTGEAVPKSTEIKIPRDNLFAVERRLGNLSQIVWLREVVSKLLPNPGSIIPSQVLYSGFHSGDSIRLNELPQLREEIALLKSKGPPELREFIETLESLMNAAEAEGNPIVFV
jgi:hypothetical protein